MAFFHDNLGKPVTERLNQSGYLMKQETIGWQCTLHFAPCCRQITAPAPHHSIFGQPFVKRFALCYQTVVCLSCPVCLTFVYCGQTVGWIQMKLGMQVGLGPGYIVLDGDPAPPLQRGTAPNFRHISVMAKWSDGLRCHLVSR